MFMLNRILMEIVVGSIIFHYIIFVVNQIFRCGEENIIYCRYILYNGPFIFSFSIH